MSADTRLNPLIASAILAVLGLVTSVHAQTPNKSHFDLPPQPLGKALTAFAVQAGVNLYFDPQMVSGLQAPALKAELSVDDGLARLLTDTKLKGIYVNENTVRVVKDEEKTSGTQTSDSTTEAAPLELVESPTTPSASGAPSSPVQALAPIGEDRLGANTGNIYEVIVTAQKRSERLQDVPISISVLGGKVLDGSPFSGVTEALNTVPGVVATPSYLGGGTQLAVRGVTAGSPLFEGSSPIAYYLDGVPFGLIKSAIAPDENVYDLQRIEVLRGPQGTLYGASALNGVVRVLTNDADPDNFEFKARTLGSATQGGGGNYRGDVAVNAPIIEGKLAVRGVLGYENDSGWIDTPLKRDVNDAQMRNYRLKVNARPTDALSIDLSAWRSRSNNGAPSTGHAWNENSSVIDTAISTNFDAYGVRIGYETPFVSVSSMTSYLDYENRSTLDLASFVGAPYALSTDEQSNIFSEELVFNSRGTGPWRWSLGGMYRHATDDVVQVDSTQFPVLDSDDTSKSYAVFGEVKRLLLDDRIELTAGLRRFEDHVTQEEVLSGVPPAIPADEKFHATSPRAVVAWHPNVNSSLYASYSQGFRSGAPQDAAVPAGFPPLLGDKLNNYELGARGSLHDGLFGYDVAVYYIDWKHVQQSLTVPYNGLPQTALVNGKSASGAGLDLSLTVRPTDALTFDMTFSGNRLQMDSNVLSSGAILFSKGDRLNYSPAITAGASLNYVLALGSSGLKGRFSVGGNYSSAQSDRQQLGADVIVERGDPVVITRVGLAIDSPLHWTVNVFADNANNYRRTPLHGLYGLTDFDARVRPRTIGAQLEYHLQ